MLRPQSKARFSEDGLTCDFVEGPWVPPANAGNAIRQEAKEQYAHMEKLDTPAGPLLPYLWLLELTPLLKLQNSEKEAALEKFRAYAKHLGERSAFCFTQASLGAAARKFDWFPSFKELDEFLASEEMRCRIDMERMKILSEGQDDPDAPKPWSKERGEDRKIEVGEFVTREMKELIAIMDEKDRKSGWAEKDPRPRITGPLPHEDVHPSMRSREMEIDRVNALSEHRKLCEAWGNRMRERDLAEIRDRKKGKLNA